MNEMPNSPRGLIFLALCWPAAFLGMQFIDPIPQDQNYHQFAHTGNHLGIPNFWNVVTNMAFVIGGVVGLNLLRKRAHAKNWIPEIIFFVGLILTGFGSAYFHFEPNNWTLFWDRLPMTIAFMAFFISILGHSFDRRLALNLLPLALSVGAASVIYWIWQEFRGAGDLRYYAVVQFLPMLLVPLTLLLWPPKGLNRNWLWLMLALYIAAKVCEWFDVAMAEFLPLHITGHALKHLFAGASGLAFAKALSIPKESAA